MVVSGCGWLVLASPEEHGSFSHAELLGHRKKLTRLRPWEILQPQAHDPNLWPIDLMQRLPCPLSKGEFNHCITDYPRVLREPRAKKAHRVFEDPYIYVCF